MALEGLEVAVDTEVVPDRVEVVRGEEVLVAA